MEAEKVDAVSKKFYAEWECRLEGVRAGVSWS